MKIRQSSNRGLILVAIVTAGMITLSLMQWNIGNKTQLIENNLVSATQLSNWLKQKIYNRFQYFILYSKSYYKKALVNLESPLGGCHKFSLFVENKIILGTGCNERVYSTIFSETISDERMHAEEIY